MKLQEEDWSGPSIQVIEVEYPDEPIAEFLNWMRRSRAWHDAPDLVRRKLKKLNEHLMDVRNAERVAEATRERNRQRTEAARAALAAKRQQEVAEPAETPSMADLTPVLP